MSRRIRVLVVDDSAFVRKAIERMLGTADDVEVVGFAADGEEGLAKARELRPDVPSSSSRIIAKLLAKSPDDRYQSARGLLHDLERCERERAPGRPAAAG